MATYQPQKRVTVYAPRTVDPTEATVLTPAAGAAHADPFQISTLQGMPGWQPYLGLIKGRRGRLDPLSKAVDLGEITVPVLDKRAGAPADMLTRWVTAFFGDATGRSIWIGLKVYVEESLDGGATWAAYWTGRISDAKSVQRLSFLFSVRDFGEDMQVPVFVGAPHAATAGYAQVPSLLPLGLLQPFGSYQVTLPLTGSITQHVAQTVNGSSYTRAMLRLDAPSRVRADNMVTDDFVAQLGAGSFQRNDQSFSYYDWMRDNFALGQLRAHVTVPGVSAGDFLVMGCTAFPWAAKDGDVWNVDTLVVEELHRTKPTDAAPPGYLAMPADGTPVTVYVTVDRAASGARAIAVNDVSPLQFWKDLLDGYYGYLWSVADYGFAVTLPPGVALGDPKRRIPYNAAAFAALLADPNPWPTARFVLTAKDRLDSWAQKNIEQAYQLGHYFNGAGELVPVDLRRPTTLPTTTLTDADLAEGPAPEWEHSRDSAIANLTGLFYQDFPSGSVAARMAQGGWPRGNAGGQVAPYVYGVAAPGGGVTFTGSQWPQALALFQAVQHQIPLIGFGQISSGGQDVTVDGQGFRAIYGELQQGMSRVDYEAQQFAGLLVGLQAPFAAGTQSAALICRRTAQTNAVFPGSLALLQISNLPDPATHLRGGLRVGRCVERSEEGLTVTLRFIDLGLGVVAAPPALSNVTQQVGNVQHGALVTVTLNASLQRAEVQFALSTQPGAPSSSSPLWTFGAVVGATSGAMPVTIAHLPGGARVWPRARTVPGTTDLLHQPSSWVLASSNGYVDLAALVGPSGLATTSVTAYQATLTWAPGASDLPQAVYLTTPSADPTLTRIAMLGPTTAARLLITGLTANSSYKAQVQGEDGLGGVSPSTSVIFSTPTTAVVATAPMLAAVTIAFGGS